MVVGTKTSLVGWERRKKKAWLDVKFLFLISLFLRNNWKYKKQPWKTSRFRWQGLPFWVRKKDFGIQLEILAIDASEPRIKCTWEQQEQLAGSYPAANLWRLVCFLGFSVQNRFPLDFIVLAAASHVVIQLRARLPAPIYAAEVVDQVAFPFPWDEASRRFWSLPVTFWAAHSSGITGSAFSP